MMTKGEIKARKEALEKEQADMRLRHERERLEMKHKWQLLRLECDHKGAYHGTDRTGYSESYCSTCGYST